jgi:hypothetical protein
MRKQVVVDDSGRILAIGPHPDDAERDGENAPTYQGFEPLEGQQVHTVEFPDASSEQEVQEMLTSHRVRVEDGRAVMAAE